MERSYTKELLDRDDIPFEDIKRNMRELEFINTRLGGHDITLRGIRKLAGGRKHLHVCEIGCGGGDNLKAISRWCRREGIRVSFTGVDIKDTCIDYALENTSQIPEIQLVCSDYRTVQLPVKPDIIFSSLFCHHFNDEEVKDILRWKYEHAGLGFFINDLHRHPLAFHSIRLLTRLFSSSYLVKNDAPLSVLRGFVRGDWENFLQALPSTVEMKTDIQWAWAFRWLVTVKKK